LQAGLYRKPFVQGVAAVFAEGFGAGMKWG
jgi:hypothetical protein